VKIDSRFPKHVAVVLAATGVALAYPLATYGSGEIAIAVGIGALLSTVNVLLGFLAVEYSFEKSYTTFLKAVLGGMGLRMMFLLGVMLVLILRLHIQAVALTISILAFYLVFLVMEILFIQKKVSVKNEGQ